MKTYEEFLADVRRLRSERWLGILAGEPPGRLPGRRPRDPEQERLLALLDRARLECWEAGQFAVRRRQATPERGDD